MYLHTLVSFTSPNAWALLRAQSLAGLKPGMSQLCNNILGALVQKGFFQHLKVLWQCFLLPFCITLRYSNILLVFELFAANSNERHHTKSSQPKADLIQSCIITIHTTIDFGQFHRKPNDHVHSTDFIIASISLSNRNECQRFNANVSHA